MSNFTDCTKSELYKYFSAQITEENLLTHSKSCIVTKQNVFYEVSVFTFGSVLWGLLKPRFGFFEAFEIFKLSTYKKKKFISNEKEEIHKIKVNEVKKIAILAYQEEIETYEEKRKELKANKIAQLRKSKELKKQILFITKEIEQFAVEFDADNNQKADLLEFDLTEFKNEIKTNSDKIISLNPEYLKNLIQLHEYLTSKNTKLNELFHRIKAISVDGIFNSEEIVKFNLTEAVYKSNPKLHKLTIASRLQQIKKIDLLDAINTIENASFEWKELIPEGKPELTNEDRAKAESAIKSLIEYFRREIFIYQNEVSLGFVMVYSLTNNDLVTFYEIYNTFDKQRVFDSQFQKETSKNMEELKTGINELNANIKTLISKFDNINDELTYQFSQLNSSLVLYQSKIIDGLKSVNSKLAFNNMLTGIQTYQLYKINKNTKANLN